MLRHFVEHRPDFWRPTWENVINNLNACPKTSVDVLDDLGVIAYDVLSDDYAPVLEVARQLSVEHNNIPVSTLSFISFTSNSKTFGKHSDNIDVYCLQALGKTKFSVWENDEQYDYELKPGDMIHVPAGFYHSTEPLGPRVIISYGIEVHDMIL